MRQRDVFEHFGGVQANVCKVLGLGRATVSAWQNQRVGTSRKGEYVPEICAWRLHHITGGRLPMDPALYDRLYKRKLVPYADVRKSIHGKSTKDVHRDSVGEGLREPTPEAPPS
jgi:hypothetical protein